MSDSQLVVVGQQAVTPFQAGGLGLDFSNRLFQLKPANLNINQRMTQAEGAIPGKFRISETGEQFDEMHVVLLRMPTRERQWYQGEPGQLNRTPDNLMCFSRDCSKPDPKAKIPQALACKGCSRASWDPWREKLDATGIKDKLLIPQCDDFYRCLFIDTMYKLPLSFYVRGGENKTAFEKGMQELARKFKLLQTQGVNPNIFDLRFTMRTKAGKAKTNYILDVDGKSIRMVTEDERAEFGAIYEQYTRRNTQSSAEAEAQAEQDEINQQSDVIDAEVIESTGDGTITV